ncbi:MAG: tetratricopeptide repeat protein, partial [bacterium]|nr:tetratricopeptide repeat protein [bacterium]
MIEINRKKTCWLVALLLLLWIGLSADKWYNNYEKAEKAITKKDWAGAVKYLREALKGRGEPDLKVKTYGMRFPDYLPYYYLGLAHYESGQYKEAQTAFERSLGYGKVKDRSKLNNSLQRMLADCKEKLKPVPPKPEPPKTEPPKTE